MSLSFFELYLVYFGAIFSLGSLIIFLSFKMNKPLVSKNKLRYLTTFLPLLPILSPFLYLLSFKLWFEVLFSSALILFIYSVIQLVFWSHKILTLKLNNFLINWLNIITLTSIIVTVGVFCLYQFLPFQNRDLLALNSNQAYLFVSWFNMFTLIIIGICYLVNSWFFRSNFGNVKNLPKVR